MKRFIFIFSFIMQAVFAWGEDIHFSEELNKAIVDGLSKTRCFGGYGSSENVNWKDYCLALETINRLTDGRSNEWARRKEGADIRAKMIVIADDFRRRAEVYDLLRQEYMLLSGFKSDVPVALPRSPDVLEKYQTSDFRLVFEGLLLSPLTDYEYEDVLLNFCVVLGKLGDQKTVCSFAYLLKAGAETRESYGVRVQSAVVNGLLLMPSDAALDCLLDGLSIRFFEREKESKELGRLPLWKTEPYNWAVMYFESGGRFHFESDAYEKWENLIRNKSAEELFSPSREILLHFREVMEKRAKE